MPMAGRGDAASGEERGRTRGASQPALQITALRSPLGEITLARRERGLIATAIGPAGRARILRRLRETFPGAQILQKPAAFEAEREALRRYLSGELRELDVEVDWRMVARGSFAHRLLSRVRDIPYGELLTHEELAEELGARGAARAVERVLAANPLPIVVPAHRAVETGTGEQKIIVARALDRALLEIEGALP